MAVVNRRIFNTEDALHGSFNGRFGKWQLLTYTFFVLSYALIIGWINRLLDYTMVLPKHNCTNNSFANFNTIQKLSGPPKHVIAYDNASNETYNKSLVYDISNEYGNTVLTEFKILCDMESYTGLPRLANFYGYVVGALVLGYGSDRGGRKMIVLSCIWVSGIMSIFQIVGEDFVSFTFFQFFIGLFVGGVQASFLPAIIEMFPINYRTFYGTFFHLVICLFEIVLPWLAKSFRSWRLLQIFVTAPIVLTAVLQWFVYESIFWYLAHKEYDKAIQVLTKLAKRNGLNFESKFKQAKEFLHAKHSKATQVDIMPLLRLQDIDLLGQKYPQVDMAELQKQKSNSSKFRRFLNSLKGESYRSTNTTYMPFDFIYSPTMLVYVFILAGLWLTNGFTNSMESITKLGDFDHYVHGTLSDLSCLVASVLAVCLALIKIGRRWMIFLAYLVIEVCLLGSVISDFNTGEGNKPDSQTEIGLVILYHLCRFSAQFGLIFLMLITAELFPTSLRCTGMGICFTLKMVGSAVSSPLVFGKNKTEHRLAYCLLTLFFGSMTLFLPETKRIPLPRSILQIEAMPGIIGKKLRSRKVKEACERVENNQQAANRQETAALIMTNLKSTNMSASTHEAAARSNPSPSDHLVSTNPGTSSAQHHHNTNTASGAKAANSGDRVSPNDDSKDEVTKASATHPATYDTVSSVHDIEQDDHVSYYVESNGKYGGGKEPLIPSFSKLLAKIPEVPSKNITRNNSVNDVNDIANSKF